MRIGFLLGSFDPIHIGHLYMATESLNENLVDKVIFVPTFQNPWKERSVDFHQRRAMIQSAIYDIPNCELSEVEQLLSPPYYSSKTLEILSKQYQNDDLYLIVGADVSEEIKNWYNGDWILKQFKLIIVHREGYTSTSLVDIQRTINISSSYVRNLYKNIQ